MSESKTQESAKPERYFIVKVRVGGVMLNDGTAERFETLERAAKRAEACRFEGEYAEIRELVLTERVVGKFFPYGESCE
jgi:predicted MarR family transcription regulator